jgi:hypothetical protein
MARLIPWAFATLALALVVPFPDSTQQAGPVYGPSPALPGEPDQLLMSQADVARVPLLAYLSTSSSTEDYLMEVFSLLDMYHELNSELVSKLLADVFTPSGGSLYDPEATADLLAYSATAESRARLVSASGADYTAAQITEEDQTTRVTQTAANQLEIHHSPGHYPGHSGQYPEPPGSEPSGPPAHVGDPPLPTQVTAPVLPPPPRAPVEEQITDVPVPEKPGYQPKPW